MNAIRKQKLLSVQEYLAGELVSPIKHEYLGGVVYAMAGGKNKHNRIAVNILARLYAKLLNQPCQPYNSDTKIRVRFPTYEAFYYPDVSVVCDPNSPNDSFHDRPIMVVEVLSESTRRIDLEEKKNAYLTLPSLQVYLLVEQDEAIVYVYRRTEQGFVREVYEGLETKLPLSEIQCELPLAEIYAGVDFTAPPEIESI